MLFWDLANTIPVSKAASEKLGQERLDSLWNDLKHDGAVRAYQALVVLVRHPGETVPFVRRALFSMPATDPSLLIRLIAELDAETFAVREKASAELARLGFAAGPALQRALEGRPTAEARRRLNDLVDQLAERASEPEHASA